MWAILATGVGMSPAVAARVRDLPCVAVNDAFRLAPWARALVANDHQWWNHNPDAFEFAGAKLSSRPLPPHVQSMHPLGDLRTGTNSGLLGLHAAIQMGGRDARYLLCGFNLGGEHYFGRHKEPLHNPTAGRFAIFIAQFNRYAQSVADVDIVNCTPGSALDCFPKASLDEVVPHG